MVDGLRQCIKLNPFVLWPRIKEHDPWYTNPIDGIIHDILSNNVATLDLNTDGIP